MRVTVPSAHSKRKIQRITGLGIDRLNLSLFKLMRLDVLRMNGAHWNFAAKELV